MDLESLMAIVATDVCILVTSAVNPGSRPQLWIPKLAVSTRNTLGGTGGKAAGGRESQRESARGRKRASKQASGEGIEGRHSLMSCNLSMSTSSSKVQYACGEYSTRAGDRKK